MSLERLVSMSDCALAHPADIADEVAAADLLEDVAGGACHDGGEEGLIVGVRGQHQAGNLGIARPDLPADLDAAPVGQPDVENGHVGLQGG